MRSINASGNAIRVSVLVLNHNGLLYLQETIPALLQLSYPELEILVFDNGSTDGSLRYLRQFDHIRCVENPQNIGYSAGKNEAVRHATGDYVLMLDNDILIEQTDILQHLLAQYTSNTAFIQVPLLDWGAQKTRFYGVYYSLYGVNFHLKPVGVEQIKQLPDILFEIPAATGGCLFFRRSLWQELGGFDTSQPFNLDDIDIGPRASLYGYRNYLYTRACFDHLGVGHVSTAEAFAGRFKWQVTGHARSMYKNYGLLNLCLRFPIFWLFMGIKAVRYSFIHRTIRIFWIFLEAIAFFVQNFSETNQLRRYIQQRRVTPHDRFLQIKPPQFDK